jgi:hypothetical protein
VRSLNGEFTVVSTDRANGDLVMGDPNNGNDKVMLGAGGGNAGRLRLNGFSTGYVQLEASGPFFTGPELEMRSGNGSQTAVLTPDNDGSLTFTRGNGTTAAFIAGGGFGGQMALNSSSGTARIFMDAAVDGTLNLRRSTGDLGVTAQGGSGEDGASIELTNSSAIETVELFGGSVASGAYLNLKDAGGLSAMQFHADWTGDNSVQLPDDAISAAELESEPGIATDNTTTAVALTGGVQTVLSEPLVAPTSGYVLVLATCQVVLNHVSGTSSFADFGVSDDGAFTASGQITISIHGGVPSGQFVQAVTVQAIFSVSTGSHAFQFLADEVAGQWSVDDTQLSLVYFPTLYGVYDPPAAASQSSIDAIAAPSTETTIACESEDSMRREVDALRFEVERMKAIVDQAASKPE